LIATCIGGSAPAIWSRSGYLRGLFMLAASSLMDNSWALRTMAL
jgi:hypothetical protein